MIPPATPPTCALCGARDSIDLTDWDGRMVPACGVCLEPPDVTGDFAFEPVSYEERFREVGAQLGSGRTTAYAVLSVIRRIGPCKVAQIADELGVGGHYAFKNGSSPTPNLDEDARSRYMSIAKNVERMAKRGELASVPLIPGKPRAGYIYSLPEAA